MKIKNFVVLLAWLIVIALTGVLALTIRNTEPLVGGMFAGMSFFLAFGAVVVQKYGQVPIGPIVSKSTVLKLGIWPVGVLTALAILLIFTLSSAPFLLGFLETLIFAACFMFATLAVIARNPERENHK